MNNLNRVIVSGNLVRDVEIKRGSSGTAYGSFCIAVNSSEKKDGQWVDTVSFFEVTAFGKLFESQQPFMKKGTTITVEGKLRQDSWETKEGQKRTKIVIISDTIYLSGSRKQSSSETQSEEHFGPQSAASPVPSSDDFQEDFPF